MYILGGNFKRRKIEAPNASLVRPSSALVRGAIFNICQNDIEDAVVLDLCAGSGALGLEALSRGAKHAYFVDNFKPSKNSIQKNIESLGVARQASVYLMDAKTAISFFAKKKIYFDIIFFDPPYFKGEKEDISLSEEVLRLFLASSLLQPSTLLFLEEGGDFLKKISFDPLELHNVREYGSTYLYQYQLKKKIE